MKKIEYIYQENTGNVPNKISLDAMRTIWNDSEREYTEEQLIKLREFIYIIVECIFKATKQAKENCNSRLT